MSWKLRVNFSDGSSEELEEDFETREEAEAEYNVWLDSWSAGAETLELAGEDFSSAEIEDADIWEE